MTRRRTSVVLAAAALLLGASHASADGWAVLRRPLHLPHLVRGAHCPISGVDRRVDWKAARIFGESGIGRGPVYPGLGGTHGLIWGTPENGVASRWFGDKVFWYVAPSYRGPVLVRGRRIDGPEWIRFGDASSPTAELRIDALRSVSWTGQPPGSRGVPSSVRVRAPGCYAFQFDGTSFSRVVVVTVDLAR